MRIIIHTEGGDARTYLCASTFDVNEKLKPCSCLVIDKGKIGSIIGRNKSIVRKIKSIVGSWKTDGDFVNLE